MAEINFEKIKPLNAFAFTNAFLTICAGGFFLFLYKTQLFYSLDYFRLVMLSLAIPSPILLINSTLFFFNFRKGIENVTIEAIHEKIVAGVFMGSVITILIFYFAFLIEFLFDFGVKTGVCIITILELIIFLFLFSSAFSTNGEKPLTSTNN